MNPWIDRRRSGVLLHISSLPGPFARGVLGEEAHTFIDLIADAGFTVWQFLPLGPTHDHGSPYESLSSAAGNPEFIDLRDCVNRGWLNDTACQAAHNDAASMHTALVQASDGFWQQYSKDTALAAELDAFLNDNADWLDDYALFAALKIDTDHTPWWQWPIPLRDRSTSALNKARAELADSIRLIQFQQFLFAQQWQQIKTHAEQRGVQLFGDVPIYVAHDSVDVWANRQYFTVNSEGLCDCVAGVPPDYFAASGQRWGNPLYDWDVLKADHFNWWVSRLSRQLARMHLVRIDHFRGLESYWAIPADSPDGRTGEWLPAPGAALLETLHKELGKLPLIAEDLGLITPEVTALREEFGLPGMKILQFAFGDDAGNAYLPHHHEHDSVAYTGTHDNDTSLGWYNTASEHERTHLCNYLHTSSGQDIPLAMIRSTLASVAKLAIIPAQDLLKLPTEARFNTPGTVDNNWCWRLVDFEDLQRSRDEFQSLNRLYARCSQTSA